MFKTRPQTLWWRKATFQIHLWTGIAVGLYIVVISVSGSAIVFRGELGRLLTPIVKVVPSGERLPIAALVAAAQKKYPRLSVLDVQVSKDPTDAVELILGRAGTRAGGDPPAIGFGVRRRDRVFDPYTGNDLGDRVPHEPRIVEWTADLHDNLLGGDAGRIVNGAGALALLLMCITGAVIWWPGIGAWRRSLTVRWTTNWRRVTWELHSATGFWLMAFLAIWAVSGVYLVFPEPFQAVVDATGSAPQAGALRFGDWAPGAQ